MFVNNDIYYVQRNGGEGPRDGIGTAVGSVSCSHSVGVAFSM